MGELLEFAAPRYIGCYKDDHSRDLKFGPKRYGFNAQSCNKACSKRFKYFALQDGGWCCCDNRYGSSDKYKKQPDSECKSNRKGGPWRNAVYEIKKATTTTPTTTTTATNTTTTTK